MPDPRVAQLARVLVNYCVAVQQGQLVSIQGLPAAQPLLKETYREVLRAGGHPYLLASIDGLEELFYSEASDEQLEHVSKVSEMIANEFDARIVVLSSSNTRQSVQNRSRAPTDLGSSAYRHYGNHPETQRGQRDELGGDHVPNRGLRARCRDEPGGF